MQYNRSNASLLRDCFADQTGRHLIPVPSPPTKAVDVDVCHGPPWYIHWENIRCVTDDGLSEVSKNTVGQRVFDIHDPLASRPFA